MIEIDYERLDRDFRIEPYIKNDSNGCITKLEKPSKNDLEYLYIELNIRKKDICQMLNISQTTFARWLKFYDIKKSNDKIVKNLEDTNMKIYGVKHHCGDINKARNTKFERYGDANFVNPNKAKQTKLKKYGNENYYNIEKAKKTRLERYDDENYNNIEQIKKTNLEKRGVEFPTQCKENLEKRKELSLEKYGRNSVNQIHYSEYQYEILNNKSKLEEFIKSSSNRTYLGLATKLGVNDTNFRRIVLKYNLENLIYEQWSSSKEENEIKEYIEQYYKIECNKRKYLNGREIDIYIPEKKIGIEFNGNYWHNEFGKDMLYHQEKSLLAEQQGIFIYHIFEYEWKNNKEKVIHQLNHILNIQQKDINNNDCKIEEKLDSDIIQINLIYDNKVVIQTKFQNENDLWLMQPFEYFMNYNIIGGEEKIFNYFIQKYKLNKIVCYTDIGKISNDVYKQLKFEIKEILTPKYIWCKQDKIIESDDLLIESDMHKQGYYKIYDCGQKYWIWSAK